MAVEIKRTMRLSQTVSPFGVGSILDVNGESLMGADISLWNYDLTVRVPSRRLEDGLGVSELRSAPSVPSYPSARTPGIAYQRFPGWLFCQDCRCMHQVKSHEESDQVPACPDCRVDLVPMRFIAVCTTGGHAMDIPWGWWAHSQGGSDDQRRCRKQVLVLDTRAAGGDSLSGLVVQCRTCRAERHLGDLQNEGVLGSIGIRCDGRQPWQRTTTHPCKAKVEVLQRGATQVTFNESTTALDIPEPVVPVRDLDAEIRKHRNFENLRTAPSGPRAPMLVGLIAEDVGAREDLVREVASRDPHTAEALREVRGTLLNDEWLAFIQALDARGEVVGDRNFKVSSSTLVTGTPGPGQDALAEVIADVVLAQKLREVRVLHGFRRYALDADVVPVDLGSHIREKWLPAVESFGEGVFLTLNSARLENWERNEGVLDRCARLERRRRESLMASRFIELTPRLILLHTLAHLLMRRLAFSCGYSSASLRERIYAADGPHPEAGLLIYTAAGDAEGTLGGLVRQGEPPRLARTLLAALEEASWCSSDPLCRESRGQGMGALNLAACHGCCLAAETSCERSNVFLDRILLVGSDGVPGFFADVLASVHRATVGR